MSERKLTGDAPLFSYMQRKAERYLAIGPDAYRQEDYFNLPSDTWTQEELGAVENGLKQIVEGHGIDAYLPLEGLSGDDVERLARFLHFRVSDTISVAGVGEAGRVSRIELVQAIMGGRATLYADHVSIPEDAEPDGYDRAEAIKIFNGPNFMFGYLQTKARRYLDVGAVAYREDDYFDMPSSEWTSEQLASIGTGMQQLSDEAGLDVHRPLVALTQGDLLRLAQVAHFRVSAETHVDGGQDGYTLRKVELVHSVSKGRATLYVAFDLQSYDEEYSTLLSRVHKAASSFEEMLPQLSGHSTPESALLFGSSDEYFDRVTPVLYGVNARRHGSMHRPDASNEFWTSIDCWILPTGETVFLGYVRPLEDEDEIEGLFDPIPKKDDE